MQQLTYNHIANAKLVARVQGIVIERIIGYYETVVVALCTRKTDTAEMPGLALIVADNLSQEMAEHLERRYITPFWAIVRLVSPTKVGEIKIVGSLSEALWTTSL